MLVRFIVLFNYWTLTHSIPKCVNNENKYRQYMEARINDGLISHIFGIQYHISSIIQSLNFIKCRYMRHKPTGRLKYLFRYWRQRVVLTRFYPCITTIYYQKKMR